ncbi:hypothetical protein ACLRGF_14010 [Mycetocola zhadangensis]|uniref:hypothetical protein n=1 Tax=Mycetocola zhadangensis TaxID=1164595 RepID=UPI003A4DD32A
MPLGMDIGWTLYLIVIAAIVLTLFVVVVRLILAATRALNAYADDRKLRIALTLDEVDPVNDARVG